MTTDRDPRTRIVLSWLREDTHENAERVLLRALDAVDATPQRRSRWPAWRTDPMNTYAKLIAAAAAVLVVAVIGYQFLPGSGGVGSQPTIAPSPSPALLARGTFTAQVGGGYTVELDATGEASSVTGTMVVSNAANGAYTVDLECTRTIDGLLWIGGDVTESTNDDAPAGTRAAIVLKPGSPVEAIFVWQMDDPRSASCQAFFEGIDRARGVGEYPSGDGTDRGNRRARSVASDQSGSSPTIPSRSPRPADPDGRPARLLSRAEPDARASYDHRPACAAIFTPNSL